MNPQDALLFKAQLDKKLSVCDLHGLRASEVKDLVEQFISNLLIKKEYAGRLVYGFGTGALREAVLGVLRLNKQIARIEEESGSCIILLK